MHTLEGIIDTPHLPLAFTVPEGATTITIRGAARLIGESDTGPFVHLYIHDSNGDIRGARILLNEARTLCVSAGDDAYGTVKGPIPPGKWTLHLYNVDVENWQRPATRYTISIGFNHPPPEIYPGAVSLLADNTVGFDYAAVLRPEPGWYKGDLHAHTRLSDGSQSPDQVKQTVEQQGLDFLFITDHNVMHPQLPVSEKALILPGVEISTGLGHMNVLAPQKGFIPDAKNPGCGSSLLSATRLGGLCSLNHPYMTNWEWRFRQMPLSCITTLEICCDPTWEGAEAFTARALGALSALWNSGNDIVAVGGSDSHILPHETYGHTTEPSIFGDPSTHVYAENLSANAILAGIRQGHVYVERDSRMSFSINSGGTLPGDIVQPGPVSYRISTGNPRKQYTARVVVDGNVEQQHPISSQTDCLFEIDMRSARWARIDITDAGGNFAACINPVRTRTISPSARVWGDLPEVDGTFRPQQGIRVDNPL